MKNRFFNALLFAAVCISTSFAHAGDFTTDLALWQSTVCADNSFDLALPSLVKFDGTPIADGDNESVPNGQDLGWGSLSQFSGFDENGQLQYEPDGVVVIVRDGLFATTPLPGSPIAHNLNPALGTLEGFCFRFGNRVTDVRIFDGDTLISSITSGLPQVDPINGEETHICWENTDGVNVTRIELETNADAPNTVNNVLVILDGEFRFTCDPEPAPTCFAQLAEVQSGIDALLADANESDAYWLEGALDCIIWIQDDVFWEQPSGNRLSQYGGTLFVGAAYTVAYLECVDDPAADALIDELLTVLECIVDNEIAYALENDGNTYFIENAEHFAELGEIIDEDFDNQVIATLAYRLAWLYAYHSTE